MNTKQQQQPATLLPSCETLMAQAQVFASAWAIAGSKFDAGEGIKVANQEKANLADMFRRLHAENEILHAENESLRASFDTLRTGYDAARQEIESLKAKNLELERVCDATYVTQGADAYNHACYMMEQYQAEREAARKEVGTEGSLCDGISWLYTRIASLESQLEAVGTGGWMRNGALLYRLTDECRPTNFDEIRVTMANGSRDIGQMSAQAERLLVMLTAPQPAPGVETVSEREFKQFLSDVITAAGLVTHGNKCKDLGRRLGEMSMRLLTAPKTAAAPAQAGEYQPSSADMVMAALDTEEWGLERIQRCDYISDEGNREGAWLVKRQKAPYCAVYTDKPGAPYGPRSWSGPTALDALQKAADDLDIRLPQPAARGAAQAAPVDAAVQQDAERYRWLTFDHADAATRMRVRAVLDRLPVMSYSAACEDIDAARAAQKETND